jgi:SAM-dependent methyltransferase
MSNMEPSFERTIDWEAYWAASTDVADDDANGSAAYLVDPLLSFLDWAGAPESYADVGCGGGVLTRAVAEEYPDTAVYGFDASRTVVEANRARTGQATGRSVQYDRGALPDFEPEQRFDVISCVFTLCYVPEVEAALQALYEAVAPGGYLVCTYHNRYAAALFRHFAAEPEEHLPADGAWDPDRFEDRFELVIEEVSTLSYDRIHETLGTWPQSLWSVADETERYPAWRQNPLVYIPK